MTLKLRIWAKITSCKDCRNCFATGKTLSRRLKPLSSQHRSAHPVWPQLKPWLLSLKLTRPPKIYATSSLTMRSDLSKSSSPPWLKSRRKKLSSLKWPSLNLWSIQSLASVREISLPLSTIQLKRSKPKSNLTCQSRSNRKINLTTNGSWSSNCSQISRRIGWNGARMSLRVTHCQWLGKWHSMVSKTGSTSKHNFSKRKSWRSKSAAMASGGRSSSLITWRASLKWSRDLIQRQRGNPLWSKKLE